MQKINYLYYEELTSTNDKLLALSNDQEDFTVVYTLNQSSGRGYGTRVWQSPPRQNLTFSFLISFDLNKTDSILALNFWVITQLHIFVSKKTRKQKEVKIKWPNDLIFNKKKLAGVLIENKITGKKVKSIIGIGMNVNQAEFGDLKYATSLYKETHVFYDLNNLLVELMQHFFASFTELKNETCSLVYFNNHLFMKNEVACFEKNGKKQNGIIQHVTKDGELCVLHTNDLIKNYKHKEIALLF